MSDWSLQTAGVGSAATTFAACVDERFAEDVRAGLSAAEKSLPCVYFYDARGSSLFERITHLPEYYLTGAERDIISRHATDVAAMTPEPVQVVELGSGMSTKTVTLLDALLAARKDVTYLPVDVCSDVLEKSAAKLRSALPGLVVRPIVARYEESLNELNGGGVLLLWLGSSIGNLGREHAARFLSGVREQLSHGDQLLIGIDLVKDAAVLEAAYDDTAGVTAAFNLNLLTRINRELGGRFDLGQFRHVARWNAEEGRIEMYLESRRAQAVEIAALEMTVEFASGERIHTENSHKYTPDQIEALAERAGLTLERQWFDARGLFSLNSLLVDGQA